MKSLLFIYNPTSGKGKIASGLSAILDTFSKAGFLVTAYPTQCKGDATRIVKELGSNFDRVVCSGGDGTLSETVAGLMELESPPILGYIPTGSTNDCASTLQLPKDSMKAAAVAATEGSPRPLDIGKLNGHPFVYVAAFGAFTEVSYDTPQELKNTFGHLAYVLAGIASIPSITPFHLKIEYDGGQVIEDDFFYGMVCNTLSVGGMKALDPSDIVLDDGLFEVVLVKRPVGLLELGASLQSLIQKSNVEGSALISFKASHLTFTSENTIPWTLDGEYGGSNTISVVENCPRALTVIQGEK